MTRSLFGLCHPREPRFRNFTCGKTAKSDTGSIESLLKGEQTSEVKRIQVNSAPGYHFEKPPVSSIPLSAGPVRPSLWQRRAPVIQSISGIYLMLEGACFNRFGMSLGCHHERFGTAWH